MLCLQEAPYKEAHFYAIQLVELAMFLLDKTTMIAVEQNKDQYYSKKKFRIKDRNVSLVSTT